LARTLQKTQWMHCKVQPVNKVMEINTVNSAIRTQQIIKCLGRMLGFGML